MTEHTPRPWFDKKDEGTALGAAPMIYGHSQGRLRPIAKVLYWPGSEDNEVAANARLIIAAPELLDCLMELVRGYENALDGQLRDRRDRQLLDECRSLIGKLWSPP